MRTMLSAHFICFDGFKQDQLGLTIFNSITNYIFLLLQAIYSIVFAFVCHHLFGTYGKARIWNPEPEPETEPEPEP